jgi:Ca2+-binding RTX toxin-like protein
MALIVGHKPQGGIYDYNTGVTDSADQIIGNAGVDFIYGRGGNDIIKGGGGADHIYGGDGRDGATYEDSDVGVDVSLVTGKGHGGTAEGDQLNSIEDLYGSKFGDKLVGNAQDNLLDGRDGNDVLKGGGGQDVLKGGVGDDVLDIDGLDNDHVYGGDGNDTLVLSNSKQGMIVDLSNGYIRALDPPDPYGPYGYHHHGYYGDGPHHGWEFEPETSHVTEVENVIGTNFDDKIIGSDGANNLSGNGGNDYLSGKDGNDVINGDAGWDLIAGGKGADTLTGGADADTFFWTALNESVVANGKVQDVITDFEVGVDKIDLISLNLNGQVTILDNQSIGGTNYSLVGHDANHNGHFDDGEFAIAVKMAQGAQLHQSDLILV